MNRQFARCGLLVVGMMALAVGFSLAAAACSCAAPGTPEDALEAADAVFSGRVIGLRLEPQTPEDPTISFMPEDLLATFIVSLVWKGTLEQETVVRTTFTCCVCGYAFQIGETYLVYAYGDESGIRTSVCTRTKPIALAKDDLDVLGPGQHVEIEEAVEGEASAG
ncbi:hypothetical protein ACFLS0_06320 [Candidatus Bipolaricaulota bacterium]